MGVLREEEGAGDGLLAAVVADGLGDGGDVVLVEGGVEGAAAMAGGSEGDALGGDGGVGMERVKGRDEARDVDEVGGEGLVAGLVWCRCWAGAHPWRVLVWENAFDSCTIWDAGLRRKCAVQIGKAILMLSLVEKMLVFSEGLA